MPQEQEIDAKEIDRKLEAMRFEGETPEERIISFKKQHWVDATIGEGYLRHLYKETTNDKNEHVLSDDNQIKLGAIITKVANSDSKTIQLDELSREEKDAIFHAIDTRGLNANGLSLERMGRNIDRNLGGGRTLQEQDIIDDKKEHWVDGRLTQSVADKVNEVHNEKMGKAIEGIKALDLNGDGSVSLSEIQSAAHKADVVLEPALQTLPQAGSGPQRR